MNNEDRHFLGADSSDSSSSDAGQTLSSLGASKGGMARAHKLSPERRREIARAAVEARWAKEGKVPLPKATNGGDLRIGSSVIPCAVLENGTRVLNQAGFLRAMGRARSPKAGTGVLSTVDELPFFLQAEALKPYISDELKMSTKAIFYLSTDGARSVGYDARLLPQVCEVYLKFRDAALKKTGHVPQRYDHIVKACDILMRGLANVGIIALVDEATGYQDSRAKDALAKILEAFVAKELRPYLKTFPPEFYKEMYRLRGWHWPSLPAAQSKRSPLVGKFTDNLVYERLAPGVKDRLKELVGRDDSGRLKHKMFQRLTDNIGEPKLREHLSSVVALMKAADEWKQFMKMLDRALPRHRALPLFDEPKELEA
jgi:hypothetical protein